MTPESTLYVRRAPEGDLPKNPQGFDRIIVSGSKTSCLDDSPWVGELIEFVKRAVSYQKPYLGICYGHQILARALGSKESVRKAEMGEFGWSKIEILDSSSLFKGVPQSFYSFSSHYEEVSQLAKGVKNLARSEACQTQACQLEKLPIYGIQFHPEKSLEEAKNSLIKHKKSNNPPPLLNATRSDELHNPKIGEKLFQNFLQLEHS
jgi:GMP synthase (glutamine-hydrolysing)